MSGICNTVETRSIRISVVARSGEVTHPINRKPNLTENMPLTTATTATTACVALSPEGSEQAVNENGTLSSHGTCLLLLPNLVPGVS